MTGVRGSADLNNPNFQMKLFKTKDRKIDRNDVKVFFSIFDKDRDGKLTSGELKSGGKRDIRGSGLKDSRTVLEQEMMWNKITMQLRKSDATGRLVFATEGNVLNMLS